jgi:hypothetical protein
MRARPSDNDSVGGDGESSDSQRHHDSISMATQASPPPASIVLSGNVSLSIPSSLLSMVLEVGSWCMIFSSRCVISKSLDLSLDLGLIGN